MRIEKVFCDFCGKEGALTQRKDARQETIEVMNARGRNLYVDLDKSVPSVAVSYAKRIAGGGIEEIDLCSKCRSSIEHTVESIVEDLIRKKSKKTPSNK